MTRILERAFLIAADVRNAPIVSLHRNDEELLQR